MTRSSKCLSRIACLAIVFMIAATVAASAQTFTTIANLDGKNGENPGSLVQGLDGNLYGITETGGITKDTRLCPHGCGTVFKITPSGEVTTLDSFCVRVNCPDGSYAAGIILATDGNFYGTTVAGGQYEGGTVFKITAAGILTTLYSFCSLIDCPDGAGPAGPLLQASNQNFYGTTFSGGTTSSPGGTAFEISPQGQLTTLHTFCCADSLNQSGSLLQGTEGNIYGITGTGGANNNVACGYGCGTVFEISLAGDFTTLYNFCSATNCADGLYPTSLLQAANGNLYGTDLNYTTFAEIVFELTPSGTLINTYDLQLSQGGSGTSGLLQATDGNFYGTASNGGSDPGCGYVAFGCGTVFEVTSTGEASVLHYFCSQVNNRQYCGDGYSPNSLIQATDGNFYGTTYYGGTNTSCGGRGCGIVFRISTGLQPFLTTVPVMGGAGTNVILLGHNFTGSTGVTFDGVAAGFTVVSSTEITATVPAGAATGRVEVTTSNGVLKSNKDFLITQ